MKSLPRRSYGLNQQDDPLQRNMTDSTVRKLPDAVTMEDNAKTRAEHREEEETQGSTTKLNALAAVIMATNQREKYNYREEEANEQSAKVGDDSNFRDFLFSHM